MSIAVAVRQRLASSATYVSSHWLLSSWRLRAATVLVGILVLGNVIALAAYRMTEQDRAVSAGDLAYANQSLEEMQVASDPAALRTAIAEADSKLSSAKGILPVNFKEADLLGAVMTSAEKSGAQIVKLQAVDESEEVVGDRRYRVQKYHAETQGDMPSLVQMLTLMESALPSSAVVDNVIMEPIESGWSFSFDLLAYARAEGI